MSTSDVHSGNIKTGIGLTTPGGRCTGLVGIDMLPRRPSNRSLKAKPKQQNQRVQYYRGQ